MTPDLLKVPGISYSQREFVLTLERALAAGRRDAVARRLMAAASGDDAERT